jgi:hypothetical protein
MVPNAAAGEPGTRHTRLVTEGSEDRAVSEQPPERDDVAEPAPDEPVAPPPPATTFAWTPDLAAGRAPDAPPSAPPPRRPILDSIAWAAGLVGAIVVAGASVRARTGSSAFTTGENAGKLVGSVIGGFLIALLLWGIVVLVTRRRGRPRRLSSPVVPALAVVVLLLALVGAAPASGPTSADGASPGPTVSPTPSRHTLDQVLVIDAPYRLEDSPPDESAAIVQLVSQGDKTLFRSVDVRRIRSGTTLVGYAVLADVNVAPGLEALYLSQFERGVTETSSSAPPTHATIRGRDVLTGVSEDAGYAVWIEAPYLKIVFTVVPDDARRDAATYGDE